MDTSEDEQVSASTGQVKASAADVYEEFFVPALFGQWPPVVLDAAGVERGHAVLDVGCGTGVLARAATERTTSAGLVTGVDVNEGMLAVARRAESGVDWKVGDAEDLPFPDQSFDRVLSQFVLMFVPDPLVALSEMARVLRPRGMVGVATWASIESSPGYAAMVALLRNLFGDQAAAALRAPFTIGTEAQLRGLVEDAFTDVAVARHEGVASFESLDAWLHTDVRGWTLADMIDDDDYTELRAAARSALSEFVGPDGRVSFVVPALVATGRPTR